MQKAAKATLEPAVRSLAERLGAGSLTVWATLKEDSYETSQGDGYYAYVEDVFLRPTAAAAAVELAESRPDAGRRRWRIRRYDLQACDGEVLVRPAPTAQEPTTVEVLAERPWSARTSLGAFDDVSAGLGA